jgi:hypothetical protein
MCFTLYIILFYFILFNVNTRTREIHLTIDSISIVGQAKCENLCSCCWAKAKCFFAFSSC